MSECPAHPRRWIEAKGEHCPYCDFHERRVELETKLDTARGLLRRVIDDYDYPVSFALQDEIRETLELPK